MSSPIFEKMLHAAGNAWLAVVNTMYKGHNLALLTENMSETSNHLISQSKHTSQQAYLRQLDLEARHACPLSFPDVGIYCKPHILTWYIKETFFIIRKVHV